MVTRPALALFTRALRADARGNMTYITRLAFFAFLLFAIYGTYKGRTRLQAPGKTLFAGIVVVDFIIITLLAISSFATSITEEKELGALGLLRMTRVTPLAIVLGKWGSRLFLVFLLLIAQCPFTILSVAFGGITLPQILSVHISLSAYLVLTSSIALFASVVSRRNGEAVFFTMALLVAFFLTPWVLSYFSSSQGARYLLYQISIIFPSDMLQKKNYGNWHSQLFFNHIVFSYGASLFLLIISTLTFDYFNREEGSVKAPSKPKDSIETGSTALAAEAPGTKEKSRRAWSLPHLWFEFTYTSGGFLHWLMRLVFALGFVVFIHYSYTSIREWRLFQWILSGDYIIENGHLYYKNSQAWILFQGFSLLSLVHLAHGYSVTIQQELRDQTLWGLTFFPVSLPKIFQRKLIGLALAHSPYLFGMLISIIILFAQGSSLANDLLSVRGLLLFSLGVFFVNLVAYLSLWIRWGAFYAGLGFILVTHICYRYDPHFLVCSLALLCALFAIIFRRDIVEEWQRRLIRKTSSQWSIYHKVAVFLFSLLALALFVSWALTIWTDARLILKLSTQSKSRILAGDINGTFSSVGLVFLVGTVGFLLNRFRLTTPPICTLMIALILIGVQFLNRAAFEAPFRIFSIRELTVILLCLFGGQILSLHMFAVLDYRARE